MVVYPLTRNEEHAVRWGMRLASCLAVTLILYLTAISLLWRAG